VPAAPTKGCARPGLQLYETAARAVKQVDGRLRVGGPATSNFVPDARFAGETEDVDAHRTVLEAEDLDALDWRPVWLEDFFAFCRDRLSRSS
jgi:xylan 1,4-beta-xylosidase